MLLYVNYIVCLLYLNSEIVLKNYYSTVNGAQFCVMDIFSQMKIYYICKAANLPFFSLYQKHV